MPVVTGVGVVITASSTSKCWVGRTRRRQYAACITEGSTPDGGFVLHAQYGVIDACGADVLQLAADGAL